MMICTLGSISTVCYSLPISLDGFHFLNPFITARFTMRAMNGFSFAPKRDQLNVDIAVTTVVAVCWLDCEYSMHVYIFITRIE